MNGPQHTAAGGLELEGVSQGAQWLLQVGALLAEPFEVIEIADRLGESSLSVLPLLQEVVHARLLIDCGSGFCFRDQSLRLRLGQTLTRSVREVLHRDGSDPDEEQSTAYLFRVIERMKFLSPKTSAELMFHVLPTLSDDDQRHAMTAELVRLLAVSGQLGEARALGEAALERAGGSDQRAELLHALAYVCHLSGQSSEAAEYAALSLSLNSLSDMNRGRLRSIRSKVLLEDQDDDEAPREARTLAAEVVAEAHILLDSEALVCGYGSRALAALENGEIGAAIAHGSEAVRIAEESGGRARHNHPRISLSAGLLAADHLEEAAEVLCADRADFDRFGTAWSQPLWHLHMAELHFRAGRLDRAQVEAEIGIRAGERSGGTAHLPRLRAVLARVELWRDRGEEAWGHIHQVEAGLGLEAMRAPFELLWAKALSVGFEEGGPAALKVLASILSRPAACTRLLVRVPSAAAWLTRWARQAGDVAVSQRALDLIRALAERNPQVELLNAAVLHAEGVSNADPVLLTKAVAVYSNTNDVLARALAMEDLAAACALDPQTDPTRVRWLQAALSDYTSCGADRGVRTTRTELARPSSVQEHPSLEGTELTSSEYRVARLVAEGLTNREVATRLHLSPHTVDSHLRHSFVKLGISSRVKLTRWVLVNDERARSALLADPGPEQEPGMVGRGVASFQ